MNHSTTRKWMTIVTLLMVIPLNIIGCSPINHGNNLITHNGNDAKTINCTDFLNYNGNIAATRAAFENQPEQTAWEWFICLNQAQNNTQRVWETFKPSSEVYLPNGTRPQPFGSPNNVPDAVLSKASQLGMNLSNPLHNLDSYIQVDGLPLEMGGNSPNSKTAQFVRFQLLMSEATLDYIIDKQVYNINGQEALSEDLDFPKEAWELKTSWLWIGDNADFKDTLEADNYYIVQAYFATEDNNGNNTGDYTVGYAALSGMHVINKLEKDWVWATFENKNNSKYTITNGFPPEPMTNITGPSAETDALNSQFQQQNPSLMGYKLIGVQWSFDLPPQLLANSQMESAFQSRSSCIACHSTAAYSKNEGHFNFAQKTQGGILYPIERTPAVEFDGFKKLDFVWSLKRANWER